VESGWEGFVEISYVTGTVGNTKCGRIKRSSASLARVSAYFRGSKVKRVLFGDPCTFSFPLRLASLQFKGISFTGSSVSSPISITSEPGAGVSPAGRFPGEAVGASFSNASASLKNEI
jgi:hypothetical protein